MWNLNYFLDRIPMKIQVAIVIVLASVTLIMLNVFGLNKGFTPILCCFEYNLSVLRTMQMRWRFMRYCTIKFP